MRRLGPGDAPAYKRLRDAVLAADPTAFTSDAAEEAGRTPASYATRLGPAGSTATFGAFVDGRLVGALTCERDPRRKVRHVGHLAGMMVADGSRGLGLGRALLRAGLGAARDEGLELLTLTVTAGNAPAAHLYRSVGFELVGTLPRAVRVDGQYHAKEQMALLL